MHSATKRRPCLRVCLPSQISWLHHGAPAAERSLAPPASDGRGRAHAPQTAAGRPLTCCSRVARGGGVVRDERVRRERGDRAWQPHVRPPPQMIAAASHGGQRQQQVVGMAAGVVVGVHKQCKHARRPAQVLTGRARQSRGAWAARGCGGSCASERAQSCCGWPQTRSSTPCGTALAARSLRARGAGSLRCVRVVGGGRGGGGRGGQRCTCSKRSADAVAR